MATARLQYDDASLSRRVRSDLTLVSDREEVVTEVSSTDTNLSELPKRIKMSDRDFKLFLVTLKADEEPNDALKTAADRFKQKHG